MVSGIEECCDYAGQHGVYLALENHGGPTTTPEGMLQFIRDVRSPWFGVNLDTGNFFTDDPYVGIEQVAPYAVNVQVKAVTTKPEGQNKKPTDLPRVAKILRGAGYRGYIVVEYEEPGDPRVECANFMTRVREAFA
jgi:sugar phosphate isomerase/epimerase